MTTVRFTFLARTLLTNSFFQGRLWKVSARNNFKKNDKIAANFFGANAGIFEKEKVKRKKEKEIFWRTNILLRRKSICENLRAETFRN